jgi:serine/threonine protein phosphatase 1
LQDSSPEAGRQIAIGDIHGCALALAAILEAVSPHAADLIVTLGDYVDRGPDTASVIDMLLALARSCRLVPLLGNHDQMMLEVAEGSPIEPWLRFGGAATLQSYGADAGLTDIPKAHLDFLRDCLPYYETDSHIFVHASYLPDRPLAEQPRKVLLWESLRERQPDRHISGKTAICGHTSQKNGEILDLGYLKCIDTYCYGGGWLTALDLRTGAVWQADCQGRLRTRS